MINRILKVSPNRSYFLFGPRQTGKSTYVKALLASEDLYISLLPQRTYLSYLRDPNQFREEVLAHHKQHNTFTCVVDEIQKIPALLDEVHDLIESYGIRFILTGSSARKLKRGAANLLAGRANTYHLYPCVFEELGENFDLEKALTIGCLPYLWSNALNSNDQIEFLRSYTDVYLREEIQAEGVVRNIAPFARFIDIAAHNDGEITNYTNIARECSVTVKTIQEYYQILEDTFIAYRIDPWIKSIRKRLVAHPRYYLFDMGVSNALCLYYQKLNPIVRGRRFEQFIILQLLALNNYYRLHYEFFFWRTHTGVEIDLIITREKKPVFAIEIKSSTAHLKNDDTQGLREFKIEYPAVKAYILSPVDRPRLLADDIQILPWQLFFKEHFSKISSP